MATNKGFSTKQTAESVFLERMLPKHVESFDMDDVAFFERLESETDRALFLGFKIKGIAESAGNKAQNGGVMNPDEEEFCRLMKRVFNGDSIQQYLQRPRQLPMGWMNQYLTREARQRVKARFDQELRSHLSKAI